jgi:hypothetical protein
MLIAADLHTMGSYAMGSQGELTRLLMHIGARKAGLLDPSRVERARARYEVQAAIDEIGRRYGQIEAEEAVLLFELRGVVKP